MNRVVLDTDVASYYSRAWQSDRGALDALKEEWDPALSFMTVAELRAGALLANWGIRRMGIMEDFIRQFEIIHSDDDICGYWAEVRSESREIGREISPQDAWIAATALSLNAPLATNNRRDYKHIADLDLLDL